VSPGAAQGLGSVNLVKREKDGTLAGDIADGLGFVKAWRRRAIA